MHFAFAPSRSPSVASAAIARNANVSAVRRMNAHPCMRPTAAAATTIVIFLNKTNIQGKAESACICNYASPVHPSRRRRPCNAVQSSTHPLISLFKPSSRVT